MASLAYGIVVLVFVVTTGFNPLLAFEGARTHLHLFSYGIGAIYLLIVHTQHIILRQVFPVLKSTGDLLAITDTFSTIYSRYL